MESLDHGEQSEDVSDFLRRIKELGERRDSEDGERRRKLEEDIAESRRLRETKRAERARSLSPEKVSPLVRTNSPLRLSPRITPRSRREFEFESESSTAAKYPAISFDSLTTVDLELSSRPPMTECAQGESAKTIPANMDKPASPSKPSSSTGMPLSRSGTLSWQQRPSSLLGRPVPVGGRATPIVSPSAPTPPESAEPETVSRSQISQNLATKDPSWFRQTSDRGMGSPAFRKNRDEEQDTRDSTIGRRALHGLLREPASTGRIAVASEASFASEGSSESGILGDSRPSSTTSSAAGMAKFGERFPAPSNSSQASFSSRSTTVPNNEEESTRLSKTKLERPDSPTKGMGGFVQSAMLKRSDSINKRWSSQAMPGLIPKSSNRGANPGLPSSVSLPKLGELSREASQESDSRPGSSNSIATTVRQTSPVRSTHQRSQSSISTDMQSPPSSSTRWSPLKSSWLESALSKPDIATPSPSLSASQPSWMTELAKNKQQRRANSESPTRRTGEAQAGDCESVPFATPTSSLNKSKPYTLSGNTNEEKAASGSRPVLQAAERNASILRSDAGESVETSRPLSPTIQSPIIPLKSVSSKPGLFSPLVTSRSEPRPIPAMPVKPSTSFSREIFRTETAMSKEKPITPPKKDFRGTLKSRSTPSDTPKQEEPEFKNVFGNLKRTKTANYVAPDELKSNILRGKAGLAQTDGPKKTERRDELKEDLLRQKEAMKAKAVDPAKVPPPRKPSESITPEAIAKRKALGSNNSFGGVVNSPMKSNTKVEYRPTETGKDEKLQQTTSAPPMLQTKSSSNKLADRFNPALASMLARGPPSIKSPTDTPNPALQISTISNTSRGNDCDDAKAGELQHMTKSRARGPNRRAPKGNLASADKSPLESDIIESKSPQTISKPMPPVKGRNLTPIGNRSNTVPASASTNKSLPLEAVTKPQTPAKSPLLSQPHPRSVSALSGSSNFSKSSSTTPPSPVLHTKPPKPSGLRTVVAEDRAEINAASSTPISSTAYMTSTFVQTASPKTFEHVTMMPNTIDLSTPIKTNSIALDGSGESKRTSVKAASALWGREPDVPKSPAAKKPITLPTYRDIQNSLQTSDEIAKESGKSATNGAARPLSIGTSRNAVHKGPILALSTKPEIKPTENTPTIDKPQVISKPASCKPPSSFISNSSANDTTSSQTLQTQQLFANFFDEQLVAPRELDVDVASIVATGSQAPPNITTLRKQISEISRGGKISPVLSGQEHILFSDRVYVCNHIFRDEQSGARETQVYLWAGAKVSESEVDDSQLFARPVARESNTKLIIIRQGKEIANFLQALGGTIIVRNNDSTSSYMLCGRQHLGHFVFDEVPYLLSTLCSGFTYIISPSQKTVYLWKGAGASVNEIGGAKLIAMDLCPSGQFTAEIDEGSETSDFLSSFHSTSPTKPTMPRSAGHWKLKPAHENYQCRLFRIEYNERPGSSQGTSTALSSWGMSLMRRQSQVASTNVKVTEIVPFCQQDVESENVYVLDAWFEVYIIFSPHTRPKSSAVASALLFAQEYSLLATSAESRPHVPFASVVLEGAPRDMKACFRGWEDKADTSLLMAGKPRRAGSLKVVGLKEALNAMKIA